MDMLPMPHFLSMAKMPLLTAMTGLPECGVFLLASCVRFFTDQTVRLHTSLLIEEGLSLLAPILPGSRFGNGLAVNCSLPCAGIPSEFGMLRLHRMGCAS